MISIDLKNYDRKQTKNKKNEQLIPTKVMQKEYSNILEMYKINQKLLVRYGKKGKKAPKRRYVCIVKIEKVGKYDMYEVGYIYLVNNQNDLSLLWENITDLQVQCGSNKERILEKKLQKRLRDMVKTTRGPS